MFMKAGKRITGPMSLGKNGKSPQNYHQICRFQTLTRLFYFTLPFEYIPVMQGFLLYSLQIWPQFCKSFQYLLWFMEILQYFEIFLIILVSLAIYSFPLVTWGLITGMESAIVTTILAVSANTTLIRILDARNWSVFHTFCFRITVITQYSVYSPNMAVGLHFVPPLIKDNWGDNSVVFVS